MKKGFVNSFYTSVYKNNKNIIVTSSSNSSTVFFHILNKDFDISAYLNRIVDKSEVSTSSYNETAVDTTAVEAPADTIAAPVDTTAYYGN